MLHSERLGDESAHRPSQYACTLEAQRFNYMRGVVRKLSDVKRLSVIGRAPDPAMIEKDELVGRRESINERRVPVGARLSEPIQDQKRPALPDSTRTNLRAIDLNLG